MSLPKAPPSATHADQPPRTQNGRHVHTIHHHPPPVLLKARRSQPLCFPPFSELSLPNCTNLPASLAALVPRHYFKHVHL
ncbi:unnamed protein product [Chondrus crispus]|uniref:Uncharacterized protein n=1 Tax=Chondrus crispus TaxID=2769 RepID=R7Q794_CHOCR|nr:unnamed protein product [Chondrus crispus]CDF33340.1 unnamed protein product [Chondrus crispus]|eukprot:XP_005713143.1 unnamed protein product [Chondrus crispus]